MMGAIRRLARYARHAEGAGDVNVVVASNVERDGGTVVAASNRTTRVEQQGGSIRVETTSNERSRHDR